MDDAYTRRFVLPESPLKLDVGFAERMAVIDPKLVQYWQPTIELWKQRNKWSSDYERIYGPHRH